MIKRVWAVYFSPNKSTAKVAETIAAAAAKTLKIEGIETYDWTLPEQREKALSFTDEDLVVLGTPTYAGRVPNKAMPYLRDMIKADGALAVSATTYGNRAYTDSPMENALLLQENGFKYIGGAIIVTEHCMNHNLGQGRPTDQDWAAIADFGTKVGIKAGQIVDGSVNFVSATEILPGNNPVGPYYKPLEANGQPANFLKAKPVLNEDTCLRCGTCARVCPMGSISKEDPKEVTGVCIKCHACVNNCPVHSRHFDNASLLSHIEMIVTNYKDNIHPDEFYL